MRRHVLTLVSLCFCFSRCPRRSSRGPGCRAWRPWRPSRRCRPCRRRGGRLLPSASGSAGGPPPRVSQDLLYLWPDPWLVSRVFSLCRRLPESRVAGLRVGIGGDETPRQRGRLRGRKQRRTDGLKEKTLREALLTGEPDRLWRTTTRTAPSFFYLSGRRQRGALRRVGRGRRRTAGRPGRL